jgi:hypothetical protein
MLWDDERKVALGEELLLCLSSFIFWALIIYLIAK